MALVERTEEGLSPRLTKDCVFVLEDGQVKEMLTTRLGEERVSQILSSLCTPPLDTTLRCRIDLRFLFLHEILFSSHSCFLSSRDDILSEVHEILKGDVPSHLIQPSPSLPEVIEVKADGPHEVRPQMEEMILIDSKCGESGQ
jgi:hypothetical protein